METGEKRRRGEAFLGKREEEEEESVPWIWIGLWFKGKSGRGSPKSEGEIVLRVIWESGVGLGSLSFSSGCSAWVSPR